MARFKVTHSTDACCIEIKGDVRNPEPTTAVIRFPGGFVEVSRCSDGSYYAHLCRDAEMRDEDSAIGRVVASRVGYSADSGIRDVPPIPNEQHITQLALRIARG